MNRRKLEHEVKSGRCHLVRDVSGNTLRVVQLDVLHLQRPDNCLCVRLATWSGSITQTMFDLPATKCSATFAVSGSEDEDRAGNVVLPGELYVFKDSLSVSSLYYEVTIEKSKSFGLTTKYLRRVCYARCNVETVDAGTQSQFSQYSAVSIKSGAQRSNASVAAWDVFALRALQETVLYAWIPEEDYDRLKGLEHEAHAWSKAWIQKVLAVGIDQFMYEPALPAGSSNSMRSLDSTPTHIGFTFKGNDANAFEMSASSFKVLQTEPCVSHV